MTNQGKCHVDFVVHARKAREAIERLERRLDQYVDEKGEACDWRHVGMLMAVEDVLASIERRLDHVG